MKLKDAVEKAEELEKVTEILEGGGTFCSAFAILGKDEEVEEWELGFYSPERDEITAVKVTEEGPEVGVTDRPLHESGHAIELDEVEMGAQEALKKAKDIVEEEYGISYRRIFLSLKKEGDRQEWEGAFIGGGTSIVSVEIDAESGEVVDSERTSFVKTGKSFGG